MTSILPLTRLIRPAICGNWQISRLKALSVMSPIWHHYVIRQKWASSSAISIISIIISIISIATVTLLLFKERMSKEGIHTSNISIDEVVAQSGVNSRGNAVPSGRAGNYRYDLDFSTTWRTAGQLPPAALTGPHNTHVQDRFHPITCFPPLSFLLLTIPGFICIFWFFLATYFILSYFIYLGIRYYSTD